MSQNTPKEPTTLEEAMLLIGSLRTELTASKEVSDKAVKAFEDQSKEMEELKAAHKAELDAVKSKVTSITKEVVGEYASKKHKKTIRFRTGFVKTRVEGELIPSAELIENKDGKYTAFLDNLIAIEYGGIEIVK